MSSSVQTVVALAVVALACLFLLRSWFGKRKGSGCGNDCGAISPEIKRLQKQLKR